MNYYNMFETKKVGELGVKKVLTALRRERPEHNMLTINRQNSRLVGYDIELLARKNPFSEDWHTRKLEVKADRRNTGNFFIELVSQEEANKLGGFLYTPADFFFYLFLRTSRLFIFEVSVLQKWIERNRHGFVSNPVRTPTGDTYFTTTGIPVPIENLANLSCTISEFYDKILKSL